jgi:hypothetical protein
MHHGGPLGGIVRGLGVPTKYFQDITWWAPWGAVPEV